MTSLLWRATQAFLLTGKVNQLSDHSRLIFWQWPPSPPLAGEAMLPALAAAVRRETDENLFPPLARHPLPGVLSPEAVPWHNCLVAAWEVHRASHHASRQNLARLALVQLDGCGMPDGQSRPSRLPEWLAEARKIASGEWRMASGEWEGQPAGRPYRELEALAALASWRPAAGVVTDNQTLRDWVRFWMDLRQSGDVAKRGLAAQALLNLADGGIAPAALLPPGHQVTSDQLLRELVEATEALVYQASSTGHPSPLPAWQPATPGNFPPPLLAEVARSWLGAAGSHLPKMSQVAWEQLLRWEEAGILTACGVHLLPHLSYAVESSGLMTDLKAARLLQWRPAPGTTPDPALLRQLQAAWTTQARYRWWVARVARWQARILLQPFYAASRLDTTFRQALLRAVEMERDDDVLFVLSRYLPDTRSSPDFRQKWQQAWESRLMPEIRHRPPTARVAAFALYSWMVTEASPNSHSLRRLSLSHWRQEHPVIPPPDIALVHAVQQSLAAGVIPDFVDDTSPHRGEKHVPLPLPAGHLDNGQWRVDMPAPDRYKPGLAPHAAR